MDYRAQLTYAVYGKLGSFHLQEYDMFSLNQASAFLAGSEIVNGNPVRDDNDNIVAESFRFMHQGKVLAYGLDYLRPATEERCFSVTVHTPSGRHRFTGSAAAVLIIEAMADV